MDAAVGLDRTDAVVGGAEEVELDAMGWRDLALAKRDLGAVGASGISKDGKAWCNAAG